SRMELFMLGILRARAPRPSSTGSLIPSEREQGSRLETCRGGRASRRPATTDSTRLPRPRHPLVGAGSPILAGKRIAVSRSAHDSGLRSFPRLAGHDELVSHELDVHVLRVEPGSSIVIVKRFSDSETFMGGPSRPPKVSGARDAGEQG